MRARFALTQATCDALADTKLMQALIKRLGTRATLKLFQDADHSFHVPVRAGSQTRCPLLAQSGRAAGADECLL